MANKVTAFLALGSNVGDRMAFLAKAREMLSENSGIKILKASKVYETEPWPKDPNHDGHPHKESGRKWFLNQVIQIETTFSPQELVQLGRKTEKEVGRTQHEHWGDRELDVDVLLYGDQMIDTPEFQIPHRHMQDRQFVLVPLVEIAPDLVDPLTGHKFSAILKNVQEYDDHKVTPFL